MACNKEKGCDCEIIGVRCLPENSFIDNTNKECNGKYTSSSCIKVIGMESLKIKDNTELNKVLRDLIGGLNRYKDYNKGRSEQKGSLEITTAGEGVILSSPNGTRFIITVADDGSIKTTEL